VCSRGSVIGDGCDADEKIASIGVGEHGIVHFLRSRHVDACDAGGCLQ